MGKMRISNTLRPDDITYENRWQSLANAIIVQAANDYKLGYAKENGGRKGKKDRGNWELNYLEARNFFFSRWFARLTEVKPEYLVQRLEQEMDEKMKMYGM